MDTRKHFFHELEYLGHLLELEDHADRVIWRYALKDNWPLIGAYAWHKYQKAGRGVVIVDRRASSEDPDASVQLSPGGMPADLVYASLSEFMAYADSMGLDYSCDFLDDICTYDPAQGACVIVVHWDTGWAKARPVTEPTPASELPAFDAVVEDWQAE